MQKIAEMTKGMNRNKQKKMRKLAKSMQETKDKGLDVLAIAININVIGIKTIDAKEIAKVVQNPSDFQENIGISDPCTFLRKAKRIH